MLLRAAPSSVLTPPAPAAHPAKPPPQAGSGLWVTHGHARPQRPEGGWSWVVHDTSRPWNSRREKAARRAAGAAGDDVRPPGQGGRVPYVAEADGSMRPLSEEEAYLQRRRTPQPRKRWFHDNRRLGTG